MTSAFGFPTPKTTCVLPCDRRHRVHVAASLLSSSSVLVAFMLQVLDRGEARHRCCEEHASADRLGDGVDGHRLDPALVTVDLPGGQGEDRVPVPHCMRWANGGID